MDSAKMIDEYRRLHAEHTQLANAEFKARKARDDYARELERELIAEGTWQVGEEIALASGGMAKISYFIFDKYKGVLRAQCHRKVQSGAWSVRPDTGVILRDLKLLEEAQA